MTRAEQRTFRRARDRVEHPSFPPQDGRAQMGEASSWPPPSTGEHKSSCDWLEAAGSEAKSWWTGGHSGFKQQPLHRCVVVNLATKQGEVSRQLLQRIFSPLRLKR